jgi:hypothetical protein
MQSGGDYLLRGKRRADAAHESWIRSPVGEKIGASNGQAQRAIRTAAHHVCVALILAVVLPPTDRAQLEDAGRAQGPAATTKAAHTHHIHTASDAMSGWELQENADGSRDLGDGHHIPEKKRALQ